MPIATPFFSDVTETQRRAREHMERGSVKEIYRGDAELIPLYGVGLSSDS